jgi:hypothetical protein
MSQPESSPHGNASGVEPRTTPDENDHRNPKPHEHPKSGPATRRPSADDRPDEAGRGTDPRNIESDSDSDEDARSRRRDLGP